MQTCDPTRLIVDLLRIQSINFQVTRVINLAGILLRCFILWLFAFVALFDLIFGAGARQRSLRNGPRSSISERQLNPIHLQPSIVAKLIFRQGEPQAKCSQEVQPSDGTLKSGAQEAAACGSRIEHSNTSTTIAAAA